MAQRGAHQVLEGDLLAARALLRQSLEAEDSRFARNMWWRIDQEQSLRWRLDLHAIGFRIAFSPDGGTLAAPTSDDTVRLIDTRTTGTRVLRGHVTDVTSVAWW